MHLCVTYVGGDLCQEDMGWIVSKYHHHSLLFSNVALPRPSADPVAADAVELKEENNVRTRKKERTKRIRVKRCASHQNLVGPTISVFLMGFKRVGLSRGRWAVGL